MIKILKQLQKKEWIWILFSLIFIISQVWLDLKIPDYMSEITTLVQSEAGTINGILIAGSFMLACALGSLLASFIVSYFAAKTAASFSARLREKMFTKTLSFSLEEINNFSTPSLITRSTNDINQIQMLIVMGLQAIVKAPILAVWAIVKISGKNWQWSAATAIAIAMLIIIMAIILILAIPRFTKIQDLTDSLNRVARENITGIRVVRVYNAEEFQRNKFEQTNEELTSNNLFANRVMAIIHPGMTFIMSALTLSIYWIGAYLISLSGIPDRLPIFSDMVVFSSYSTQIIIAFMMVSMIFILLPRATVSARRINEVLDTQSKILDGTMDSIPNTKGKLEFKNVNFKYPDASDYILKDISFIANPGETIAFIGATGSGKTTLVNLIPRFYDVSEGEILINDINIKNYKIRMLNQLIGYVSQKAVLFSGSIASNIGFGDNKTDATDIATSLEIAQASSFVSQMEGEQEAQLSQGGSNISGGQKQRLSIARSINRNGQFYIFDDSFSALDYKTDKVLRKALESSTKDATKLIVAQRIGTIKEADKIIVLEGGKIVGIGKHQELMNNCKIYQEIAYSQLSKEELA